MVGKEAFRFLREVRLELSKVTWPSFDEWAGSTIVVFVLVVFFGIYLSALDLGFSKLAQYVFGLYRGY